MGTQKQSRTEKPRNEPSADELAKILSPEPSTPEPPKNDAPKADEPVNEAPKADEAPKGGENDAPAPAPATPPAAPAPAMTLADLVRKAKELGQISEEQANTLEAEAKKVDEAESRSKLGKAMVEFNKEMETELPKTVETLLQKHGLPKDTLAGKRITIYFPKEGENSKAEVKAASKGAGGGNTGGGFPKKYQSVSIDGVETSKSPTALAFGLGYQVKGRRDMKEVFESPEKYGSDGKGPNGGREKLQQIYRVDADVENKTYFRLISVASGK